MLVRMLGPFEVDGAPLGSAARRTVLALLALHAGRPVSVPALIDAVWPDGPPRAARNSLQSQVARLRAGPGAPITLEPAGYRLRVAREAVDALRFEDLLRAGDVTGALGLWRGEAALPEFGGEPFRGFAERLGGLRRDALVRAADGGAFDALRAASRADPCWESGAVAVAEALAARGLRAEALAELRRHADATVQRLGLDPSVRVRTLQGTILRDAGTPQRAHRPGPDARLAGVPREGSAPVPVQDFVGREAETVRLAAMIAEPGVVTVTGPGGVGKTRLVAEVVRGSDAAWIDAAEVGPADLIAAVAVGMGARIGPCDDPLLMIAAAVRGRVVVLDNCEHVAEPAAAVVEALRGERVIVTSQERLRVGGEVVLVLEPLDGPAAVRLFTARAGAIDGDVADLVERLDRLPLAIELAAVQAAALGVDAVRARLDDRLDLLVRGRRTAAARHRTLRAVVAWSAGLLDDGGRRVLGRLAVFAGAFTVAQAEVIALSPAAVVAELVDRSLVARAGTGRFRLLETVRAYAGELPDPADRAATERRHVVAMVAAAEDLDRLMHSPEQAAAVRRFDALLPDLRLALGRCTADERERLAAAMYRYGYHCQQYEVLAWGTGAGAATHAWGRGDLAEARRLALLAGGTAPAHEVLGDVALVRCEADEAITHYRAMTGHPVYRVSALVGEALVHAWSGRVPVAVAMATEAVALADTTGNPSARAEARYGLGEALGDHEPERALALLTEAAAIAASADDRLFQAASGTAAVALRGRHGDPVTALAAFRDVLALWRRAGNDTLQAAALRNLVVLLVRVGADATAVLVDAALPAAGVYPAEAARLERARRAAAERLGPDRVTALRRRGALLSPARVTDEASRALDAALLRLGGGPRDSLRRAQRSR